MTKFWKEHIVYEDDRRELAVPGDAETTLAFCLEHFVIMANRAIERHGVFTVVLSGGNTPKTLFQRLAGSDNIAKVDWKNVLLFWSDERAVAPDSVDSNYYVAMVAGFNAIPIPSENIFRMEAEADIEDHALAYEELIKEKVPDTRFDMVMLGMGNDGHTASLFPKTEALKASDRLVVANHVPQKDCWRMTLTFDCINNAHHTCVYVIGQEKTDTLNKVLTGPHKPNALPAQNIGLKKHKALWIADLCAAEKITHFKAQCPAPE